MAKLNKTHRLEGYSGKVGRHLKLAKKADGRKQLHVEELTNAESHWQRFKEAVAYARKAQANPEYKAEAEARHTTAFKVATADFLHPPEISKVDLDDYHGHVGDSIRIHADDDVSVTMVGVLIVDEENHLIEMGMAWRDGAAWRYDATHETKAHHVRVVVDAADLPGHLAEGRAEADL